MVISFGSFPKERQFDSVSCIQTVIFRTFHTLKEMYAHRAKYIIERNEFAIKAISKDELAILFKNGILKNTCDGFMNKKGHRIGHYKTLGGANRMFIEDEYAVLAKEMYVEEGGLNG